MGKLSLTGEFRDLDTESYRRSLGCAYHSQKSGRRLSRLTKETHVVTRLVKSNSPLAPVGPTNSKFFK